MSISVSELYGKQIITLDGRMLGEVRSIVLNMEEGVVSHLLLSKLDTLMKSGGVRQDFIKNSISFKRVKKIGDTIIVGTEDK